MTEPVITTLLDTDLYKYTMMQAVLHQHPAAEVEYRFRCRTPNVDFSACFDDISREIDHLCTLQLTDDELDYLAELDYLKPDFIHFLRLFRLDRRFVELECIDGRLELSIRGPWLHTILFEVPLLAIISEVYCRHHYPCPDWQQAREKTQQKIAQITQEEGFRFSDFGTRRRFSAKWQKEVVHTLASALPKQFSGTSNLALSRLIGRPPMGTMAHEFLQAFQALGPRLIDSQKAALDAWVGEYRGRLGIALTDVVGMDAFLRDFDLYYAKLFDGLRHDSGDPVIWTEKALAHYRKLKVDPNGKRLVYSDSLTVTKALELYQRFSGQCRPAFGIGTYITNDVTDTTPLSMVIKMTRCNGQAVAKLSDSPGKAMCEDDGYLTYLSQVFGVQPPTVNKN